MPPELIVMLTHYDRTGENAHALFEELKDTPVQHWGFKDVGLPPNKIKTLAQCMKAAGKTTYLEVVSLSEEEGLAGARLAVETGFDTMMGTVYFDSIRAYLQDTSVKYYPFAGHVHSHPSILDGSLESITRHARQLESNGVRGLDLLAYRYTGDAPALLQEVVRAVRIPVVSAGSIDSFQRIEQVRQAGVWGFTIGSAFFEKKFLPQGSFRDNMLAVWDFLGMVDQPRDERVA
jgi:hypothetical protein